MAAYGILGGTFDPVHLGHLMLAYEAMSQLSLDLVYFIPNGTPPHKNGHSFCPAEHRYRLVELAVQGEARFVPLRIEIEKSGPAYAVDTLSTLRKGLEPGDEVYFIVGSDAFAELDTWKDAHRVVQLCRFAVARRPEAGPAPRPAVCPPERAVFLNVPQLEISSTDIRRRMAEGRPVAYMLPEKVLKYITDHHLYRAAFE